MLFGSLEGITPFIGAFEFGFVDFRTEAQIVDDMTWIVSPCPIFLAEIFRL
jgi:hypothetical protein